uniref:VWFD domain-containing protein n=1 Tax=Macrostomum lignano TaxID=282301 RepID=A0A1I8GJ02_9PLAT
PNRRHRQCAQSTAESVQTETRSPPRTGGQREATLRQINNVFFPSAIARSGPPRWSSRCVQDMCILKEERRDQRPQPSQRWLCSHLSAYSYQCSSGGYLHRLARAAPCALRAARALMTWSECASALPDHLRQLRSAEICHLREQHGAQVQMRLRLRPLQKYTCIRPNECPCTYNSVEYMPGSNLVVNCANGRWQCTYNPNCPKMCSITGSHIVTFDGAKMDFNPMGCAYTLLEPVSGANDSRLQVQVTMEPSPEYLLAVTADSQFVNLPKMITVKYRGVTIQLKSVTLAAGTRPSVIIDGVDFTNSLPYENVRSQILVRQLTSFYAMVKIGNHLSVYFDGYTELPHASESITNFQIEGLCGNFDSKTENDLHTKGSDMIAPPVQVAQSYVSGSCSKTAAELPSPGSTSQSLSGVDDCTQVLLNSDSFKACRDSKKVDILGYYYRFCQKEKACGGIPNIGELYCTAAMSAARACKTAGFQIDFSTDSRLSKCAPSCMSGGGSFTICARTCRSSCSDLSSTSICELGCFPGCDCQYDNQYRDAYGTCVRQSECTCLDRYNRNGKIYRSGAVISRQCTNCTCANGDFACGNSSCADKVVCPKDQVYLETMPACQKCINYDKCQSNQSESGRCGCPGDLVKKADGSCVAKPHCPCIYLGTEYLPGHILKIGCKTYKCVSRTWTKIAEDATKCEAVCVAYGDPHYSTFDRKAYSFQGSCQYILMKSDANAALGLPPIEVSAQNIPCGSQQVTCTKFVRVKVGSDTYVLVRGREPDQLPVAMNYGMRREKFTLFTQLVSDQLGLRILWDRSTRVYVFVKPHFNSKVSGLCGNFDGNADNDFTIKNLPINNPIEFASNFRTGGDSCASEESSASKSPQSWIEMCTANSRRRDYAESVCGAIKSKTGVFSACQQVLEQDVIENFYENCMYDACGCDTGGDCECVCTVLSAFATTCAESGVSVQWRFQDQCPIMCTGGRVYQPCMPPCAKTCHNVGLEPEPHCVNSQCIEGCACPNGYVEHDNECIPSDNCPCFYQGKEYPKGSVIHNTTSCSTCSCTKGGVMNCTSDSSVCRPTKPTCTENQYACNVTGMCISYSQFCDGTLDCLYGDDEKNCNTTCSPSYFRCITTQQCVAMSLKCDGIPQCTDGSDELNCGCNPTEIQCNKTGKCLPKQKRCDGVYDCGLPDTTDEDDCKKCDEVSEFKCGAADTTETKCIPRVNHCDGHDDCGDGSDEIGCKCLCMEKDTVICDQCKCINVTQLCDGNRDCERCIEEDGMANNGPIGLSDISVSASTQGVGLIAQSELNLLRPSTSGLDVNRAPSVTRKDESISFDFNVSGDDGSQSIIGKLSIISSTPGLITSIQLYKSSGVAATFTLVKSANSAEDVATSTTTTTTSTTTGIVRVCEPDEQDGMATDSVIRDEDIKVNPSSSAKKPKSDLRPVSPDYFVLNTTGLNATLTISLTQNTKINSQLTRLELISTDFFIPTAFIVVEFKKAEDSDYTQLANLTSTSRKCFPDLLHCALPANSNPLTAQEVRLTFSFVQETTMSLKLSVFAHKTTNTRVLSNYRNVDNNHDVDYDNAAVDHNYYTNVDNNHNAFINNYNTYFDDDNYNTYFDDDNYNADFDDDYYYTYFDDHNLDVDYDNAAVDHNYYTNVDSNHNAFYDHDTTPPSTTTTTPSTTTTTPNNHDNVDVD